MYKIEIHGLVPRSTEARDLEIKIFRLFNDKSYLREVFIVIVRPTAKAVRRGPFLRLVAPHNETTRDIVLQLVSLDMEVNYDIAKADDAQEADETDETGGWEH